MSVPVLGLTGDGWSPGFGVMSRVDRFAVILREASVKGIQQRQLGRGDHQLGRTCEQNCIKKVFYVMISSYASLQDR